MSGGNISLIGCRQQVVCQRPFGTRATCSKHRCRKTFKICTATAQFNTGSFVESVKKVAKQIQGSLPIVGLLSRLTSPEGGFDELSYNEFCRTRFDKGALRFSIAVEDMEKAYGKNFESKYMFLVLWMAQCGTDLVSSKIIMNTARRLRITQDMEIEIDRFEGARAEALKKYTYMSRPNPSPEEKATLALDCLATLILGLKDGQPVPDKDIALLAELVAAAFPEAAPDAAMTAIQTRADRALTYL